MSLLIRERTDIGWHRTASTIDSIGFRVFIFLKKSLSLAIAHYPYSSCIFYNLIYLLSVSVDDPTSSDNKCLERAFITSRAVEAVLPLLSIGKPRRCS